MSTLWWQMPGPTRFLNRLVDDLHDGNCVILHLPQYAPAGLADALKRRLQEDGGWSWERIDGAAAMSSPVEFLIRRFLPGHPAAAVWDVTTLAAATTLAGIVLWVDGATASLPAWRKFLLQYVHACRSQPAEQRMLLVVPVIGDTADLALPTDIGLTVAQWEACVDDLDMLFYVSWLRPPGHQSALHHQVALHTLAQLALWDPAVADRLLPAPLKTLLAPLPVLAEIGRERGWDQLACAPTWPQGARTALRGEKPRIHSAWLALKSDGQEIFRRLWRAQVSVVFPAVEEYRHRFLRELKSQLKVPFDTHFKTIHDVNELELGHIEYQVNCYQLTLAPNLRDLLSRLCTIRHRLAHLQPLAAEELTI